MRLDDGDISFSFLPISHITEQLLSIYCHVLVGHRGTPWLELQQTTHATHASCVR
jgi:long-subunit acyl-CoA synthetase (AMP-forming)